MWWRLHWLICRWFVIPHLMRNALALMINSIIIIITIIIIVVIIIIIRESKDPA